MSFCIYSRVNQTCQGIFTHQYDQQRRVVFPFAITASMKVQPSTPHHYTDPVIQYTDGFHQSSSCHPNTTPNMSISHSHASSRNVCSPCVSSCEMYAKTHPPPTICVVFYASPHTRIHTDTHSHQKCNAIVPIVSLCTPAPPVQTLLVRHHQCCPHHSQRVHVFSMFLFYFFVVYSVGSVVPRVSRLANSLLDAYVRTSDSRSYNITCV